MNWYVMYLMILLAQIPKEITEETIFNTFKSKLRIFLKLAGYIVVNNVIDRVNLLLCIFCT